MLVKLRPLLVSAILAAPWAQVAGAQEPTIDLDLARRYFEEIEAAGAADGGRLWRLRLDGPLLFVDPATRLVVANVADSAGRLTPQEGVHVGALPPEQNVANTALDWAGVRWSMVIWPVPSDRYDRGRLIFH